jgi:hypothetical protein
MKNLFLTIGIVFLINHYAVGQWSPDPKVNLVLASDNLFGVKSVKTSNNRLFVSWFAYSGINDIYDLHVQLLDANGISQWGENGLIISSQPQLANNIEQQVMLCDAEDNLVIVYSDIRNNGKPALLYNKLSQGGELLWGMEGLSLIENNEGNNITMFSAYCDSDNEIIVSAGIYGDSIGVFVQRISNDATLPWGIQGKYIPNAQYAKVFSTGENIVLIFRENSDTTSNCTFTLLYQFFDKQGNALFQSNKIISDAGGICAWYPYDAMMTGINQVIVTWHDNRTHTGREKSYAQLIDGAGITRWEENGTILSTEPNTHLLSPRIAGQALDNSSIIVWERILEPKMSKAVFGQKVAMNGDILWGENGKELLPGCGNFNRLEASVMDNNNLYVAFGLFVGTYCDTVHNYIGSYCVENGAANWAQPVCFAASSEYKDFFNMCLITDTEILTTWREETITSNQEVRAQNIAFDGSLGIITSVSESDKNILSIYPNPSNNFIRINYNAAEIESVLIVNAQGIIVYNQSVIMHNTLINVSDLKKGIYFINIKTRDNKTIHSRFVKI